MPVGFEASEVSTGLEFNALVTAFGGPSSEDGSLYLMFQRALEFSEEDAELGMDAPYVEYCGQQWSWYDHMKSVQLERSAITVRLDVEAAKSMGNDGIIEVRFSLDDAEFQALRAALRRTFDGASYFVDTC